MAEGHTLAEKFQRLREGRFDSFESVGDDRLSALKHTAVPAVPAGRYLFEKESAFGSNMIPNPAGAIATFIGAYSYMNGGGYLRDNVLIGRYCSIGRRVTIGAGDHSLQALSTSPRVVGRKASPYSDEQRHAVHASQPRDSFTIIESDVWIGDGAVIRPGVTLATGTVVGANAVVVKSTSPYEIVGGVAAKSLGFRFSKEVIAALLASEWWESDLDAIGALPVSNVFEFLKAIESAALPRVNFTTYVRRGK